jgi:hypothetical protein
MGCGGKERIRHFRGVLDDAPDCHCEEPPGRHKVPPEDKLHDEAISSNASNRIEIASLALRASSQ